MVKYDQLCSPPVSVENSKLFCFFLTLPSAGVSPRRTSAGEQHCQQLLQWSLCPGWGRGRAHRGSGGTMTGQGTGDTPWTCSEGQGSTGDTVTIIRTTEGQCRVTIKRGLEPSSLRAVGQAAVGRWWWDEAMVTIWCVQGEETELLHARPPPPLGRQHQHDQRLLRGARPGGQGGVQIPGPQAHARYSSRLFGG